jgi:hypothetical protein
MVLSDIPTTAPWMTAEPAGVGSPAAMPGPAVIPASRVIPLQTPLELGSQDCTAPRIEVQREGDRIVAVHVFCRCGEQITLECHLDR